MDNLTRLQEIISSRRSIRQYKNRPVERELIDGVMRAPSMAPSAGNRQQHRFWIITNRELIDNMGQAVKKAVEEVERNTRKNLRPDLGKYLENFLHFAQAPVVIAPIYRRGMDILEQSADDRANCSSRRSMVNDTLSSVAAAIENLLLAAHAAGLGACWMTGPLIAAEKLEAILEVPRGWSLAAVIPLGYPDEKPEAPPRRSQERLVRYLD